VRKSAEALAPAFDVIRLDFSTAPPIERKAPEAKKKEKPSKPTEKDTTPASARAAVHSSVAKKAGGSEGKPQKTKEKQSAATERDGTKSAANNGKATSAGTEDVGPPIPSMIDLRVGHIVDGTPVYCMQIATPFNALPVKKHPDADSLYVEASSHCVDRLLWLRCCSLAN